MDSQRQYHILQLYMILFIFGLLQINNSYATCSWPTAFLNSNWHDSTRGIITFNTTTMQGWTYYTTSGAAITDWECVSSSTFSTDGRMIMVSKSFVTFGNTYYAYLCITLTKVTDYSYRYYINRDTDSNLKGERLFVYTVNTLTDPGIICSDVIGASGAEYQMLIKSGNESAAKVRCPWYFLGRYGYVHTYSNGTATCNSSTSEWTMCTDSQLMTFNYTKCQAKVANSMSNTVWCVANVIVGSTNYVMVFNGNDAESSIDNQNVYRFTCLAISGNRSSVSVSPKYCQANQTAFQLPSTTGGALVSLTTPRELCPTCPTLSNINNGLVTIKTTDAITTSIYTCNTNYTLWGTATRTCGSTNIWTSSEPACSCGSPTGPANGSVSVNVNGSTATYTCFEGYTINGLPSRACQAATATWEGNDPTCAQCAALTTKTGQTYALSTNNTVTTAAFTCVSGYTLNGTSKTTCLSNGTWGETQPNCVACGILTNPTSGIVTLSSDGSLTTATYKCATGYTLQGVSKRTCGVSGTWDNTQPICVCNSPSSPANGNVVADGTTATYTCTIGYTISGPSSRTCQPDSTGWSGANPSCVQCTELTSVTGGSYSTYTTGTMSSAKFSCTSGYSLNGVSTITCGSDGSWNAAQPTCVQCPTLANPSSGTVTLSSTGTTTSATYACASGYMLIGNTLRLCNADGTWSLTAPACTCQSPPSLQNGNVTENGVIATYRCLVGYSLYGESARTCGIDASGWSGSNPICRTCAQLSSPSGGTVNISTDGLNTNAAFTCGVGYTLSGVPSITCKSDGNWNFTQPTCVKCAIVLAPDSGTISVITSGVLTTATFSCRSGYYISGAYMISCLTDGSWSNAPPKCKCNFPQTPTHGSVTVSDGPSGTVAIYKCDMAYSLNGLSTRACQSDGTGWEGSDPQCTVCQTAATSSNATLVLSTNGTNTQAQYSCIVGSSINGVRLVTCQSNGTWTPVPPSCVTCPTLTNPDSGSMTLSTDGVTTTAKFACNSGYMLSSTSDISCTNAGTWSASAPNCVSNDSTKDTWISLPIAALVIILLVLVTFGVLFVVFAYLHFRHKNTITRISTTPILPQEPKEIIANTPEPLPEPKPMEPKQSLSEKYASTNKALTITLIPPVGRLPHLLQPQTRNDIGTGQAKPKRQTSAKIRQERAKTPIERKFDFERMLSPDFNYISPQFCYKAEATLSEIDIKPKNKSRSMRSKRK